MQFLLDAITVSILVDRAKAPPPPELRRLLSPPPPLTSSSDPSTSMDGRAIGKLGIGA